MDGCPRQSGYQYTDDVAIFEKQGEERDTRQEPKPKGHLSFLFNDITNWRPWLLDLQGKLSDSNHSACSHGIFECDHM